MASPRHLPCLGKSRHHDLDAQNQRADGERLHPGSEDRPDFYAELHDFLPSWRKRRIILYALEVESMVGLVEILADRLGRARTDKAQLQLTEGCSREAMSHYL